MSCSVVCTVAFNKSDTPNLRHLVVMVAAAAAAAVVCAASSNELTVSAPIMVHKYTLNACYTTGQACAFS
eukprot:12203-Heterococcus_DN1.PRE.2